MSALDRVVHEPARLARFRTRFRDTLAKWQQIAAHLDGGCRQWVARHDGEPVASIIVLFGTNVHYTRGAMDKERAGPLRANDLLMWQAIQAACAKGIPCSGPHAPDTVFLQAVRGAYDLVVAMYHDQGHIPMKLIDFEGTVNISLGIPIIRTSVDHGTAFDIAGKNRADARSMKQAMRVAAKMASTRRAKIVA